MAVDPRDGSGVPGAPSSGPRRSLVVAVLLAVVAGCAEGDDGAPEPMVPPTAAGDTTTPVSTTVATTTTILPTTSTTAAPTTVPTSSEVAGGVPGAPCGPAGGDPDCTDQTNDGTYRIVEGFADCLAEFDGDTGICADLDGDGHAMYPDTG